VSHFAHISIEAGSRVIQGAALTSMFVDTFFSEIDRERRAGVSSVECLVAELARTRQSAAAAHAEVVRLRADLAACAGALGAERARAESAERDRDKVFRAIGFRP
jgi:hypothetical protein